jgi:DNA polymerase I
VHDELVLEGPEEDMPKLKEVVIHAMSQVMALKVELKVEVAWGANWRAAHS